MISAAFVRTWAVALFSLMLVVLSPAAGATHARYGHINWEPRPDISPTTVDFRIVTAFRRSYFGNLQLGSVFRPGSISFGDNRSGNYDFEVIALNIQEDWVIGQARQPGLEPGIVRHQYATPVRSNGLPWEVSMSVCCRISSLRNSADSNFRIFATVDLSTGNRSPVSSLPPIVTCARGDCRFSVPALDKDNDRLVWSLTPAGQSGVTRNPTGLTLDPETGFIDWSSGSETAQLGLYALSVTIQDMDEFNQPRSTVVTDFIINLRDFVDNRPPAFDRPPSPLPNAVINAIVGQTLTLDVQASDPDLNDQVFVNNLGLPAGASVSSLSQGNPSAIRFTWTPGMGDLGDRLLTFTATDQKAASALPLSLVIRVIQPMISDVRVIDRISANDIDIEQSTFSVAPVEIRTGSTLSEVEWHYPTFDVGQTADIQFDLRLRNLQPGETRLVIHELEMTYRDMNGNLIRDGLGSRAVQVAETVLAIGTNTDRILYRPQETVLVNTLIENLDEAPASSRVQIEITDAAGIRVQLLREQELTLGGLQNTRINELPFAIGNTPAGQYRARAHVLRPDGKALATAESPFSIVTSSGGPLSIATSLVTDKPRYGRWDNVQLQGRVQNTAANAALTDSISELRVYAPDGGLVFSQDRPLASLAPTAMETFPFVLTLNAAPLGQYRAEWRTLLQNNGQELSRSQAFFEVESIAIQDLIGRVSAADARIFHTGQTQCDFSVRNRAPENTGTTHLAYSLIHADTEALLSRQTINASINPGSELPWTLPFFATHQPYGGYLCVLEAEINGTWQVLASTSFEVQPPLVSTGITAGSRGRVLVLTDEARQCSALEDIRTGFSFGAELQGSSRIEVRLRDENGVLLDTEIISAFDMLINNNRGQHADLAVRATASGEFEVRIATTAQGLGKRYRVEVDVRRNWLSRVEKSWSIDTSCDRPFTLNELWEDVLLLGWKPWHHSDDLRDADPFGPLSGPDVRAQNEFIRTLLDNAGWDYTLVHNAEDFTREHRLGDYQSYLLLSERIQLPWQVQKEIREAVFAGRGLISAGAFDKRNLWLEPALGVSVVGRHPWARGLTVRSSDISSAWNAPLPETDTVQAFFLQGASLIAEYSLQGDNQTSLWHWLEPGNFGLNDILRFKRNAATHHHYGSGQSLFFGFDLLLQASSDGLNGSYAALLLSAVQQVQPATLTALPYSVVPLDLYWYNERGAVTARSELQLPAGATLVVPGLFSEQQGRWQTTLPLPAQSRLTDRVYLQLGQGAEQQINLLTVTEDGTQHLVQATTSLNYAPAPDQTLAATQAQLDALAWRYWYRLDYRSAWLKFKLAREALEAGHRRSGHDLLLLSADLLLAGHEHDVAAARQQLQRHIRSNGRLLAVQP